MCITVLCTVQSFDSVSDVNGVVCVCFQVLAVTILSFLLQVTIGVIAFIYREEVSYLERSKRESVYVSDSVSVYVYHRG